MERGLADRGEAIREVAARLAVDDRPEDRAELKTLAHRLRGIAGTHGHAALGEVAARLEALCGDGGARRDEIVTLARELAAATAAATPAPKATIPPLASQPPRPAGRLRVLAVDDDAAMRRLIDLCLRNMGGHDVTIVETAHAALQAVDHHPFDVVLLDAMMPGMNGLDLCRAIRARPGLEHLPLIVLSAAAPDELGWQLGSDGPTSWLRKPFRPDQVLAEISRLAASAAELE